MKKYINYAILIVIIFWLVYLFAGAKYDTAQDKKHAAKYLAGELEKYETRISELGEIIFEQKQNIVAAQQAEIFYKKELEHARSLGFKNIERIVKLQSTIKALKLELEASDSITIIYIKDTNKIEQAYLKLPQRYEFADSIWYGLHFDINSTGQAFQTIDYFYSEPELIFGSVKTRKSKIGQFFERRKKVVSVVNKNPYISTAPKYNILIKPDRSIWKPIKYVSIGLGSFYLGYKARALIE